MAYQPFTITGGNGGYSVLNAPATHSGSITAVTGTCWVRFVVTPTVTADGANANLVNLPAGVGFDNNWAFIPEGGTLNFGSERTMGASQSDTEPVKQIDLYLSGCTVTCVQH
jgi:hypothetical protein